MNLFATHQSMIPNRSDGPITPLSRYSWHFRFTAESFVARWTRNLGLGTCILNAIVTDAKQQGGDAVRLGVVRANVRACSSCPDGNLRHRLANRHRWPGLARSRGLARTSGSFSGLGIGSIPEKSRVLTKPRRGPRILLVSGRTKFGHGAGTVRGERHPI
jgi:hypothetical protein